eukprot:g82718.t1
MAYLLAMPISHDLTLNMKRVHCQKRHWKEHVTHFVLVTRSSTPLLSVRAAGSPLLTTLELQHRNTFELILINEHFSYENFERRRLDFRGDQCVRRRT